MENPPANPPSLFDRLSVFFATGLYISVLPAKIVERFKHQPHGQALMQRKWTGAGFFGSLEGAITYLLLPVSLANAWWMIGLGIVFAVYVGGRAERVLNSHDDARIVIDEWIGTWIALWGLGQNRFGALVLAVILFRVFDVFKGPIGRRLQNLSGGWGVAMDDIYAGLAANLCWRLGVLFLPGVL